jgi:hypothetical protein
VPAIFWIQTDGVVEQNDGSITAILSHEHEVRFKDGTELRQAIGLALVILLSQLEAKRPGQARLEHAIYLTKYFPLPYRL